MSSKVKKIQSNLEQMKRTKIVEMENCTMGSILVTFAKLANKTEETALLLFEGLKDNPDFHPNNIKEACDYVKDVLFSEIDFSELLPYIVLVYDENNILSPLVTIYNDIDDVLYPISSTGMTGGVIAQYMKGNDSITIEYIYDDVEYEVVDEACEEE